MVIVVTADQIDSRSSRDLAGEAVDELNAAHADRLLLPADRTAGDEIQALVADGATAIAIALGLTRTGHWSVGIGIGSVREPLGDTVRESTGDAFIAARAAVDRAKKKSTRFAAVAAPAHPFAADIEALADLLLILRARRSDQGWEIRDLVTSGLTQAQAAIHIGITPQSASKRARAAELRAEDAAVAPLARLVDSLDRLVAPPAPDERAE